MPELIAELLLLFEELKFWKKKRKEKEIESSNLPQKVIIRPIMRFTIIMLILIALIRIFVSIFFSDTTISQTIDKMTKIETILEQQKRDLGKYPPHLEDVIGTNPLRKDINIDPWGNKFYYKQFSDGAKYELKSKGKDGILNTKDDISIVKKTTISIP